MSKPFFIAILSSGLLFGQILSDPVKSGPLNAARQMENQNRPEEAITLYKSILETRPDHSQAYRLLKDLYLRLNRYDDAVSLIQEHLQRYPDDTASRLSLGEVYFRQGKDGEARLVWKEVESQNQSNLALYRNVMNVYIRLALEEDLTAMVRRARVALRTPQALSLDLGNYYYARRIYNKALEEYLLFIRYQPQQVRYISNRILLMSDEAEAQPFIESYLIKEIPLNDTSARELLSAYYFKTQQYHKALEQHQSLGLSDEHDFQRWLQFAESLRREEVFDVAIETYTDILASKGAGSKSIAGQALIGLAQTFEDQILPQKQTAEFVFYFPDNIFFENPFYLAHQLSNKSAEKAFSLYDSVLITMPTSTFSAQANYRLGEIQFRMTRNFDGAMKAYESALRNHPGADLESTLRLRIGDIFLAQGNLPEAQDYFYTDFQLGPEFKARYILSLFYLGNIDSALTVTENSVNQLSPKNPWFNDFLEMKDFLALVSSHSSTADRDVFEQYARAEMLVRQFKLAEAVETLRYIRESFSETELFPYIILREALLRRKLQQIEYANRLANQLLQTDFKDRGLVLLGEIQEVDVKDTDRALEYYHQLLEECQQSLLTEPIRLHIRKLTKMESS